jgi:uncharacterized protein YjgD (DUF1641 family)
MAAPDISQQLAAMEAKLDGIVAELAESKRQRREMQELREDLSRVAGDAFQSAVEELEDVAPFVNTGDFLHLLKLMVRNTNNITGVIHKLESALDFLEDFQPIGKELFNDGLEQLDSMDRAGYFEFAREATKIADNVVEHFTVEDVRLLAANIVPIMETVKALTQPEMLNALNNAVRVFDKMDATDVPEITMWEALRELRSPEMRRGLGFMVTFLKDITHQEDALVQ